MRNKGRGMSISDIRDMINDDSKEIDMKNNELNAFWRCDLGKISNSAYQRIKINMFEYFSSVSVNDTINKFRSLDYFKAALEHIRKVLLNVDFGLKDRLCDGQKLTL